METKRLGNLGELKALAKFAEYSIPLYIPYGEAERVDFIADFDGKFQRIQVKSTSTNNNGALEFSLRSTTVNSAINKNHFYNSNEIDYFVLYSFITDEVYIISINESPKSSIYLRLAPSLNGQTKGVRMAKDYTLDKFLQSFGYTKE